MTRPATSTSRQPDTASAGGGWLDACRRVAAVAGVPLRPVPSAEAPGAPPLADGLVLDGALDPSRLGAAAELIREVRRAERETRSLCTEILERYEEATLVYRLSGRLGAVLGERALAATVLEEAAGVLGARSGRIWLRRGDALDLVATVPPSAPAEDGTEPARQAVLRDRRPWLQEAGPGREACVAVPLPGEEEDEPIGVLLLRGRSDGRSYRTGEVKLLTALAALTSAFIRNDRLSAKAREADLRKREDEIARQVHRGLLPHGEPEFPGLELSGGCRAAENIGGDFYGYIPMPDGSLGLAIADISGHGVGAALYMASAKGVLQSEARRMLSPADLLRRTNEALYADFSRSDVFATAFFARIHPGARRLDYANGGHNPALLIRDSGEIEQLAAGGGALGVLPEQRYREDSRSLAPGELVLLFTDGLIEARDRHGRFYGLERLQRVAGACRRSAAAVVRARITEDLLRHCGATPPRDDVTLVVARCAGEPS